MVPQLRLLMQICILPYILALFSASAAAGRFFIDLDVIHTGRVDVFKKREYENCCYTEVVELALLYRKVTNNLLRVPSSDFTLSLLYNFYSQIFPVLLL